MIRRFLSLSQAERDAIYEQESSSSTAQQHCSDRLTLLSADNTLVRSRGARQTQYLYKHALWQILLEEISAEVVFS